MGSGGWGRGASIAAAGARPGREGRLWNPPLRPHPSSSSGRTEASTPAGHTSVISQAPFMQLWAPALPPFPDPPLSPTTAPAHHTELGSPLLTPQSPLPQEDLRVHLPASCQSWGQCPSVTLPTPSGSPSQMLGPTPPGQAPIRGPFPCGYARPCGHTPSAWPCPSMRPHPFHVATPSSLATPLPRSHALFPAFPRPTKVPVADSS